MGGQVVVGVDGSPASLAAAEHAAEEARLRGADLTLVHALSWPHLPAGAGPLEGAPDDSVLRSMGDRLVADAEERARAVAPDIRVTSESVPGDPLIVLVGRSAEAGLLVVGSRGLNSFTGLLIGSVAVHLAAHAHCPVMVVRGTPTPGGPVALGVDGSGRARDATAFAYEAASLRGAELLAVHAWSEWQAPPTPPQDPSEAYAKQPGELGEAEERLLTEAVAGYAERYPEVQTERRTVRGSPREALLAASRVARLLVVGARGLGGFAGLLLGSVSHAALQHAECPVVIVPSDGKRRGHANQG